MATKEYLNRENERLRQYANDLKARHDKALETLGSLAQGLGRKRQDHDENKPTWDTCMRKLAGEDLAEIAKMPLRTP